MADQDSGDKTEDATPKRLRDARKKGDIAKSTDLTSTLGLAFTLVLFSLAFTGAIDRLNHLTTDALASATLGFDAVFEQLWKNAVSTFLVLSALVLIPIAAVGLIVEFLQAGPIFALEKVKPDLSNLDPVAGVKRMFSMDNAVELMKNVAKAAILFLIGWLVITSVLDKLMWLPLADPGALVDAARSLVLQLMGWTLGIFLLVTVFDAAYQRHSYAKKMRMSHRDIRQEHKDNEGDAQLKGKRRQMHKTFGEESNNEAARASTVLVVNPTHVAIALLYDREEQPVPIITAQARDEVAQSMRDAAAEANVPVLRNEFLARTLLANTEPGDVVPRGLFDIVAEVILWAMRTRELMDRDRGDIPVNSDIESPGLPPGEDLTAYPNTRVEEEAHALKARALEEADAARDADATPA